MILQTFRPACSIALLSERSRMIEPRRIFLEPDDWIPNNRRLPVLLRGQVVKELTTAASVWSVAAIGLACGGGLYFAAGLATAIILLILVGIKPLEDAYRSRVQSAVLRVKAERGSLEPDNIKTLLGICGGQLRRIVATPAEDDLEETRLHLARISQCDICLGISRLRNAPGVQEAEFEKRKAVDDE